MTRERLVLFIRDRVIFAKLAAIILWFTYALSILLGDGRGTFNFAQEVVGADHLAWYTAARLIADGKPDKVYDPETQASYQNAIVPFDRWKTLMAYRNPPFYCLMYLPTCQLPFAVSMAIWSCIYLVGTRCAVHWLGGSNREFLWLLAFYPTFCAISYGQNSLISFAILAATYRLLKGERYFLAGLVAGLLWFKPTILLGLIVWGLLDIRKLWPCALGVFAMGGLLALGTYPFIPEVWHGFVESLQSNVKYADFEQWKMHNPLAFWRLLLPDATAWHWPLAAATSLLGIAWFVLLWRKHRGNLDIVFGAVVFLTLWASPHALVYEWSLLGIAGILWWKKLDGEPDARFLIFATAWLVLFVSSHLAQQQQKYLGPAVQLSVPVLAVVGAWCLKLFRGKAESSSHRETA